MTNSNLLLGALWNLLDSAKRGADITPRRIQDEIAAVCEAMTPPCDFERWDNDYEDGERATAPDFMIATLNLAE
jgi:hypothetical protein